MSGPEAALSAIRFVHDAAALTLWGAFGYVTTLVPGALAREIGARLDAFGRAAIALAAATTALALPVQAAAIGDGWADALDPAVVGAVVFETGAGRAWQAQAGGALLLLATLAMPTRARAGTISLASGLVLAALALGGHAAMHAGPLGVAHRLNHVVHLLAGGAWLGALLPLPLVLRALDDPGSRRDAAVALRRFSSVGHAAVALVIATGVANTLLILGPWPFDARSPYAALLAAKVALVAGMTALALANRYVLVPRMGRDPVPTTRALLGATVVETGLGLAAVGCVAVFGLLEPG